MTSFVISEETHKDLLDLLDRIANNDDPLAVAGTKWPGRTDAVRIRTQLLGAATSETAANRMSRDALITTVAQKLWLGGLGSKRTAQYAATELVDEFILR